MMKRCRGSDDDKSNDNNSQDGFDLHETTGALEGSTPSGSKVASSPCDEESQAEDSSHELHLQRKRELNRLSKKRCRLQRKEVAQALQREVSRLTAEHNSLLSDNKELRREWAQLLTERATETVQVGSLQRLPLQQALNDRNLTATTTLSQQLLDLPLSHLGSSAVGLQQTHQRHGADLYPGLSRCFPHNPFSAVPDLSYVAFPANQNAHLRLPATLQPDRASIPLVASLDRNLAIGSRIHSDAIAGHLLLNPPLHGTLGDLSPLALVHQQVQNDLVVPTRYATEQFLEDFEPTPIRHPQQQPQQHQGRWPPPPSFPPNQRGGARGDPGR